LVLRFNLLITLTILSMVACNTTSPSQGNLSGYPNNLIATISVGDSPRDICISSDGAFLYVANYQSNTVSIINTEDCSIATSVNVPAGPNGICITPNDGLVYVACMSANSVAVIRTSDNFVIAEIPSNGQGTRRLCSLPSGDFIYVANYISCNIDVISTLTQTIITSIDFGNWPEGITCNADGTEVYCVDSGTGSTANGSVGVIRTSDNTIVQEIDGFDGSPAICYLPNDQYLYVGNWHWQNLYIVDLSNNYQIIDSIQTANNPLNFQTTPSGDYVIFDGSLRVANTSTHSVEEDILQSVDCFGIAYSPDGSRMYAACPSNNLIYIFEE